MKRIALLLFLLFALVVPSAYASTEAVQIDVLLDGVVDQSNGTLLSGGTVYFYEAGTTTGKNIWTDKAKSAPYTSYTLDADGAAQLYADGLYKVVVKDSDGVTIYTWDNVYYKAQNTDLTTKSSTTTLTTDENLVLCSTNGGAVVLTLPTAVGEDDIFEVVRDGSNNCTLDGNGAETIGGAATYVISVDKRSVRLFSDGSNWKVSGVPVATMWDADNDTGIQIEESDDDDTIRFDAGGSEIATISSSGLIVNSGKILPDAVDELDLGSVTKELNDVFIGDSGLLYFGSDQDAVIYHNGSNLFIDNNTGSTVFDDDVIPATDDAYDLGAVTNEWKDIYVDGKAYLDAIDFNGTDITATGTEINQLATMDATTISANQWAAVGGLEETVTGAEINTAADGISNPPIAGDSTAGRVLRSMFILITDNAPAETIDITLSENWNESDLTTPDTVSGLGKDSTSGNFSLSADGYTITLADAAFTGNVVAVLSFSEMTNKSDWFIEPSVSSGIVLSIINQDGNDIDVTDCDRMYYMITYLTNA